MSGRSTRDSRRRALEEARQARAAAQARLRLAAWGGAVVVLAGGRARPRARPVRRRPAPAPARRRAASYAAAVPARHADGGARGRARSARRTCPSRPRRRWPGTSAATAGQAIDGISCQTSEQTVFHIHTHLTIFVNGQQRQVPAGIGIPGAVRQQTSAGAVHRLGSCFYWLHTHAADGIIHIESPVQRTYTLGEFFDEWGQPLGPARPGPAHGQGHRDRERQGVHRATRATSRSGRTRTCSWRWAPR